ncbi:DUF6929 family protein [Roseateles sp. BYS96W]|uniref:DUF6929 family protein n=1 Tax=Pelomonas nitida TaxID=3299027 RepID=A0ABW7G030_9BURK
MLVAKALRELHVSCPSGREHVSAASGLVRVGDRLFVVADDENSLGMFNLERDEAGTLMRLFPGELPSAPKARKAAKPDLESLALLPAFASFPYGALLALGSGSRKQRQRGALLPLGADGSSSEAAKEIDLTDFYSPLRAKYDQLNIEGAFVGKDQFFLLQRGNQTGPENALIGFDWTQTEEWLRGVGPVPRPMSSKTFNLGDIDGVPLCFTDGAVLPDGGWVFCAAAEATSDNYADGPCRGSAVGVVTADGQLQAVMPLSLKCKTEGIAVTVEDGRMQLLMVTDADDPDSAALLLAATLELARP